MALNKSLGKQKPGTKGGVAVLLFLVRSFVRSLCSPEAEGTAAGRSISVLIARQPPTQSGLYASACCLPARRGTSRARKEQRTDGKSRNRAFHFLLDFSAAAEFPLAHSSCRFLALSLRGIISPALVQSIATY